MGQAIRRASGRLRPSNPSPSPSPSQKPPIEKPPIEKPPIEKPPIEKPPIEKPPIEKPPIEKPPIEKPPSACQTAAEHVDLEKNSAQKTGADAPQVGTALEERNPQFDQMLNQVVGRIRERPGGFPEMGEGVRVQRSSRPMPKLRNTKSDSNRYADVQTPPGTLNIAQLRQLMNLQKDNSGDPRGPMDAQHIAEKFRLDVSQVDKILQYVSMPQTPTRERNE